MSVYLDHIVVACIIWASLLSATSNDATKITMTEVRPGDPVIFNGQTVILLGPAGNGDLYLVRLPDGTERHVLRTEIQPVKEKP